ncbi:MAG: anthranilate synthase component II [Flavobacteriales bacterium]
MLIDNYDSFTWNLHHLLAQLAEVTVERNDAITVEEAAAFERIVLSPGPGIPEEAGITLPLLRALLPSHRILGVCLGMQALVEACGGRLVNLQPVRHGVPARCMPLPPIDPLFGGLPPAFDVGLYHSWAADPGAVPGALRVTAVSHEGVVMAVRHARFAACGVQFHPESVLTPLGARIVRNWLGE